MIIAAVLVCLSGPWNNATLDTFDVDPPDFTEVTSSHYPEFPNYSYEDKTSEGWNGIELCEKQLEKPDSVFDARLVIITDNHTNKTLYDQM